MTSRKRGPKQSTGDRVAHWRKKRGFTQRGLADAAHLSRSYIAQVEGGSRAPSPAFVSAVARALRVDPALIWGQPFDDDGRDQFGGLVTSIRRAFSADLAPELGAPPRPVRELALEVQRLRHMQVEQAALIQVGASAPALIEELTVHALESDDPKVWRLLNMAHAIAVSFARRLGHHDLAALGLEKAAQAAQRGDNPTLPQVVALSRALLLITLGELDMALAVVHRAAEHVDRAHPDGLTVYGALRLRAAIAAARAGREGQAWEHHRAAEEITAELHAARRPDTHILQVTPANAAIHGCAVAVELGDYDQAIALDGALVLPPLLPAERFAHHQIDLARAELWLSRHKQALNRLLRAEEIAPVMTRYHPSARETAEQLDRHHRTVPEALRGLQRRMGM